MSFKLYTAVVLLLGFVGALFVSMVPPMRIPEGEMNCRFHFVAERAAPFSKTYSVQYPDIQAMISEYGIIIATCGILICLGCIVNTLKHRS
jgi:hypothetical protein